MGKKGGLGAVIGATAGFMIGGPAGAAMVGAAGFSAGSQMDAADAAVDAARSQRAFNNEQAQEILRRSKINIEAKRKEALQLKGAQVQSFAKAGVDVSSVSALVAMESAAADYRQEIYEMGRDALWQARGIKLEGQFAVDRAKDAKKAAQIQGIAGIIGAGAQAYGATNKTTSKSELNISTKDAVIIGGSSYRDTSRDS